MRTARRWASGSASDSGPSTPVIAFTWLITMISAGFMIASADSPATGAQEATSGKTPRWASEITFLPWVDLGKLDQLRLKHTSELEAEDVETRKTAAHALGNLVDYRGLSALSEALQDEDEGVKKEARWAINNIARFLTCTAQRPASNVLNSAKPVLDEISPGGLIETSDKSGNEIQMTMPIWEGGAMGLVGQEPHISRIAGLYVDHRLWGGNMVYFLVPPQDGEPSSVYYTPEARLFKRWNMTDDKIVLEDGSVIEIVDLHNIEARIGRMAYRLRPPGKLLLARGPTDGRVKAIGEQFKDQSGGWVSIRDWLLECRVGDKTYLSQFEADYGFFRMSRNAFVSTSVDKRTQPLGTIQIEGQGARLLAWVNKSASGRVIREGTEKVSQIVLIPRPEELRVSVESGQGTVILPSELLPYPLGTAFQGSSEIILRTKAKVYQGESDCWLLAPEADDDGIYIEADLDPSKHELTFKVLYGEGSELRFDDKDWIQYRGDHYSAGGMRISSSGVDFLQGTRKKHGDKIQVFSEGRWKPTP